MANKRRRDTKIRRDIVEAIDKAFPDAVVDMPCPFDETYLWDIHLKLVMSLSQLKGADLLYERDPEGSRGRHREPEPDEDWPDGGEQSSSHWVFFLGLTAEEFTFGCEGPIPDENGVERDVSGTGCIGCSIGVSLHAPLAVVTLDRMEEYEDGTLFCPDIEPKIFDLNFQPADMDAHFREMFDEEGVQALHDLRGRIHGILESFGITVLPEEELVKPVPWLELGENVSVENEATGHDITVKDAFFHRGP